eukprot:332788_1
MQQFQGNCNYKRCKDCATDNDICNVMCIQCNGTNFRLTPGFWDNDNWNGIGPRQKLKNLINQSFGQHYVLIYFKKHYNPTITWDQIVVCFNRIKKAKEITRTTFICKITKTHKCDKFYSTYNGLN